jgi:quercetin dioxygenase-like cupin family protein
LSLLTESAKPEECSTTNANQREEFEMRQTLTTIVAGSIAALGFMLPVSAYGVENDLAPARISADEIPWPDNSARTEGTAMRSGLQTLIISGNAKAPGLYTIMFKLQPNTKIPPHSHPDVRSCFVLSGTWYFAYGDLRDETQLKTLPVGSHYTEPAGMNHFAETRDEPVVAECTAIGPTGTTFVNPADDPRKK